MDSSNAASRAVAAFEAEARSVAEVEAFGLVLAAAATHADLYTRHRSGATGHRLPLDRVPALLRPFSGSRTVVASVSTLVDPYEVFAQRLRQYRIETLL